MTSGVNGPAWLGLRWVGKHLLRPVLWLGGFRVSGKENLPRRRRPLIVAVNHAAFIDSVYLIAALGPRFTLCGARPRLFATPVRRALMRLANILKVDGRERYLADCGALLAAGEILLIYPEMGRFPEEMGPFQPWAAEVALAAGAPILPCYLFGTTRGQEGATRLFVGPEVRPEGEAGALTARLRRETAGTSPADTAGGVLPTT